MPNKNSSVSWNDSAETSNFTASHLRNSSEWVAENYSHLEFFIFYDKWKRNSKIPVSSFVWQQHRETRTKSIQGLLIHFNVKCKFFKYCWKSAWKVMNVLLEIWAIRIFETIFAWRKIEIFFDVRLVESSKSNHLIYRSYCPRKRLRTREFLRLWPSKRTQEYTETSTRIWRTIGKGYRIKRVSTLRKSLSIMKKIVISSSELFEKKNEQRWGQRFEKFRVHRVSDVCMKKTRKLWKSLEMWVEASID